MSGEQVPIRIRSRSSGRTPASASAFCDATRARSELVVPGSETRRNLIPVRSTIQLSLVSTIFSRSRLDNLFWGAYIPRPMIFDAKLILPDL